MRKRWLSLLLALVMLASVTVTTASADTVNLSDKTVTLSVTPSQSAICVGSTGDVYVKYTISIEADAPIPAFSFVVPTDGKLATTATDLVWRFQLNTKLKQSQGGPYNTADYNPAKGYVGVGGSDNNGITEKTTVMTIVAKFPAGAKIGTYTPAFEKKDFIAGDGEAIDGTDGVEISNAFGMRNVEVDSVTVNPGATVSGTVKDSSGKAVSGATVEMYKDGTKVADATAGTDGKYTISNVSTGTYTLKAKGSDGALNGSASVTVAADSILNADVTVAKGFTVSGTVKSYGSASEVVTVTLTKQGETTPAFTDTLTGNSAAYKFENVSAGTYTLKVEKKGHAPWTEEITVGDGNVTKDVTIYLIGDVNGDGLITPNDASLISQHCVGSYVIPNALLPAADVDGNGTITPNDASLVLQHCVGTYVIN